ncbi:hypothetical protein D3C85_1077290 [compost metagenome]
MQGWVPPPQANPFVGQASITLQALINDNPCLQAPLAFALFHAHSSALIHNIFHFDEILGTLTPAQDTFLLHHWRIVPRTPYPQPSWLQGSLEPEPLGSLAKSPPYPGDSSAWMVTRIAASHSAT